MCKGFYDYIVYCWFIDWIFGMEKVYFLELIRSLRLMANAMADEDIAEHSSLLD